MTQSKKKSMGLVKFCLCCLLAFVVSDYSLASKKTYGSVIVSEVSSIYDGDTFTVSIKDWPSVAGERISVRVWGIDTPEMRGKCEEEKLLARKAKKHTVAMLRAAKTIELVNLRRDKYFRLLAEVSVDGNDLGYSLIKNNLARPYDGGQKIGWCD